jgi:hypothetical protein
MVCKRGRPPFFIRQIANWYEAVRSLAEEEDKTPTFYGFPRTNEALIGTE